MSSKDKTSKRASHGAKTLKGKNLPGILKAQEHNQDAKVKKAKNKAEKAPRSMKNKIEEDETKGEEENAASASSLLAQARVVKTIKATLEAATKNEKMGLADFLPEGHELPQNIHISASYIAQMKVLVEEYFAALTTGICIAAYHSHRQTAQPKDIGLFFKMNGLQDSPLCPIKIREEVDLHEVIRKNALEKLREQARSKATTQSNKQHRPRSSKKTTPSTEAEKGGEEQEQEEQTTAAEEEKESS